MAKFKILSTQLLNDPQPQSTGRTIDAADLLMQRHHTKSQTQLHIIRFSLNYLHDAAASFYKTASLTVPTLYAIYQNRNSWNPINACVSCVMITKAETIKVFPALRNTGFPYIEPITIHSLAPLHCTLQLFGQFHFT